ncbi:7-deoxyloganetin glucosyltransferase-like [Populus alba]|uniref:linamarin synthase n=2 Tax=Populus TaxID=3689 RepID=A0AAD6WIZ2_9ROSI|nr:7-deoxyloganetin glucosyltransferase-like [Populus alba]KAJ7013596.1 7-deoxyloganetin glucosyltransferase-like [Populus alba x Populus x berolinensis]
MADKPHAVCVPFPAQGHINPMLKLAKILHFNGFHITFVNTEYNHRRLLRSRGASSLDGLPDFQFETIPDGLPPSDADSTQDILALCYSTSKTCLAPFRHLIAKLNSSSVVPQVTCIVSDAVMNFTLDAAEEFGIPDALFWTPSACGVLGYSKCRSVFERGLTPVKDVSYITNEFLETAIEWIPGKENIRLRDLPSLVTTADEDEINLIITIIERTSRASAVIFNTFESFERDVLDALSKMFPPIYTLGPLQLLVDQFPNGNLKNLGSNLWKEEPECIEWLDSKEPNSVVYVNFGSITVITPQQMMEFAWGLANSNKPFLWIIRPDLVEGESAMLPSEFVSETKKRGMLANWCPQELVLKHPSIGGFLSHMGWNSTMDSVCAGVPLICWPFFADQQTNCMFACTEWGIGMQIDSNVKRDEVEKLVRELMEGEKGKDMKRKAMEWKTKAEEVTRPGGSSFENLEALVKVLACRQTC